MKRTTIFVIIATILLGVFLLVTNDPKAPTNNNTTTTTESEDISVIAQGLEIPWDLAFLPGGGMLVTERPGRVVHIESGNTFPIEGVEHTGEGGLLGIALHPNFSENRYVYLYQTTRVEGGLENRVVRYTYQNEDLTMDEVIFSGMPGAPYHDGGRIAFGPDEKLYITIGDATDAQEAQNSSSLNGSILRVNPDGSIPEDNPFTSTGSAQASQAVYSYGHRNPQGLAWDDQGRLWSTEHGRSGALSGMDEVNLIAPGQNYGWPTIEGDETRDGMISPKAQSGADVTWAPASAVFYEGSIFFGGLRGAALYEAVLDGTEVSEIRMHFKNEFGRIRSVRLGPDGYFYLTTSNRDGRGDPVANDDRIIRVNPELVSSE